MNTMCHISNEAIFHSKKRMTEQDEQPPELIKLKNEILPMFKLL